ncbi:CPBP family intramembrane glutamic endopeptidase [Dolosigranulum pigrum]|jgi:CAAX amino terminal protease family protein|uniref:CPBP family intramembrane glutamic endopeptidase n=1 Tax=Dolosigranulum pigrum TaxID=29394 RepID=UPI001AD8546D|nr:type II CAAX endopeptidase family protein [Dolosigranulum pigrum]QTJ45225.1 CPBP family intramembrane metalloprotease [Dolosigranulum pigrum]
MTSFIKKIGSPVKIIFLGIIFSVIATLIISVGQIPRDIFPAFVENNMPYISRYIYTIVAFILLIWWLKWWNKSVTPIYMNNTLFQKKNWVYGIGGYVLIFILVLLFILAKGYIFGSNSVEISKTLLDEFSFEQNMHLGSLSILYIIFLGPILEEFIYRLGILGQLVEMNTPTWLAVILSVLIFSFSHHNGIISQHLISGLGYSLLMIKTKSIYPGIIAHILFNTTTLIYRWYMLYYL